MDVRKRRMSHSRSPPRNEDKRARHSTQDYRVNTRHGGRETSKLLPFNARELTKHDLKSQRPIFALYLDIQKRLDIEELDDDEVKGRWKSFINKWNRGDLAEGWYDPATFTKAHDAHTKSLGILERERSSNGRQSDQEDKRVGNSVENNEEEDDDYGPALPTPQQSHFLVPHSDPRAHNYRAGPTIPSHQDIQARNEDARASAEAAHEKYIEDIRHERQVDRKLQKSRLDELAPRAEPGTRERQLEKKREAADSNRAFAASKEAGGDAEIRDSDLMGGDDLGELKRMKKEQDRRKTEREVKREEILRARMAERGQKLKAIKDKEEKTMSMLREIARDRFGGGNEQPATLRGE